MRTAETERARGRISAETTVSRLLHVTCTELMELLDARRCAVSRIIGDLLVALSDSTRLGEQPALTLYLVSDYPLTQKVIDDGEPRVVVRSDPGADPAEAVLLERMGFDSLLMLPLRASGQSWGLVELYADEPFSPEQVAVAVEIVAHVGELLADSL